MFLCSLEDLLAAAIVHYDSNTDWQIAEMRATRNRQLSKAYLEDLGWSDNEYLPPALRSQVTKSFCIAWLSLFRSIHDILVSPGNQIPTTQRLATQWDAYEIFARGGKPEYPIDPATSMAKDTSPLGDGSFVEEDHEPYGDLTACENDLAFELVREKLGLDPRTSWAPYSTGYAGYNDDSDEMDDDSD